MDLILYMSSLDSIKQLTQKLLCKLRKHRPLSRDAICSWSATQDVLMTVLMDIDNVSDAHTLVRQHLYKHGLSCALRQATPYPSDVNDDDDDMPLPINSLGF